MKTKFWKSDWFTGFLISLALLLVSLATDWNETIENAAYDAGVRATAATPSANVTIVAIDDQSIANLGRWPWPRDQQAKLIQAIAQGQPKAIGYTAFLTEAQTDAGLQYINRIASFYATSAFRASTDPTLQADAARFEAILQEADEKLNSDRWLAATIKQSGRVFLGGLVDTMGEAKSTKPPAFLAASEVVPALATSPESVQVSRYVPPIPDIGAAAAGIGHLEQPYDSDGVVRRHRPLIMADINFYPSLGLLLAAYAQGVPAKNIQVTPDGHVRAGRIDLPLDADWVVRPMFYGGAEPFTVDSAFDVSSGKIQPAKYKDKIVLIGATARGLGDNLAHPAQPNTSPVVMLAHNVSSILQNDYFRTPAPTIAHAITFGLYLAVTLYLVLLLPRLRAAPAAALTASGAVLLIAAHFYLMTQQRTWVELTLPLALLILGHTALTTKRFFMTEKGKLKSEAESAESNKMLGLAFQGQGQLDMAFEKFRKVPMDEGMMDVIYNLALDFERKRQFNKAHAAFQYMAAHNPNFRDLQDRLKRAKAMEETVLIGGGSSGGTLILKDGQVEKPFLGRYQVERELGKGAMGIVYEGRDPKIGRVVAIKTMALSAEFDPEELEEVRSRFFREAETAGRLSHPHIVTIFDAGEEHDLAYIAMEFLKGQDLTPYTKPGHLLPLAKSMRVIAKVAEALNYAHAQHVVHRDVKPANIMYEPETGAIKVTDFGIARITDSSRTRTGMVLGTPAFMSPEQLAGKKIDGRSDIFSLGSTFYQLVTGHLPFHGESVAELMYQITNEAPSAIHAHSPNVPRCVVRIIGKMMMKQPDDRYQTGAEVARALAECGKEIAAALKGKA